ncbi:N-acetylmuramoyl-L-alanine amidase family protein [Flavobacterium dankookense]|uniref:N-acetylmuramoyl-L-alanine amidase n=1 Tax=Flavobacterium dankookense TaxID=706186 RepID=A0A4R6Q7R9_9FLAO|nr:N-acetylmuramoyl-L-alanine amidase [Flavobacterium dankookense]TDP58145.1 N-acetylmuramoyl-L-alanine amidase [Flavobacterium dankookense]
MKNLFKVLLLVVAFATVSFISSEKETITVVIDAGHGGHDFGGKHDYLLEKDLANSISKKIEALNSDKNIKLLFTRDDDKFVELAERTNFINSIKPDLVLSLHVNQNKNITASGFEIFVSDKSVAYEKSNELAQKLVLDFEKNIPLKNRGVKTAPFWILKNSEAPALTLEMGFLSNTTDREYITSEEGQNQIAQTILNFVSNLK